MQSSNFSRTYRNSLTLTLTALVLSACLSEEEGDTSFNGNPDSPPVNGSPVISGNPAGAVKIGDAYSFTPSASDPDGDTLTFAIANNPQWASFDTSTGKLSGQPLLGAIGTYSNIVISVTDGSATASLSQFSISVDQVGTFSTTLSWTAPTQNEDGTALIDLAGYKLYWGTTPGSYPNSVTINNPSVSTYIVDNLSAGTYEFVATSFNASGIESRYSGIATKVLQ